MSRDFNLSMSLGDVTSHCANRKIAISALEALPDGGVRLVCASSGGADKIRTQLKRHIIKEPVRRTRLRPPRPLW